MNAHRFHKLQEDRALAPDYRAAFEKLRAQADETVRLGYKFHAGENANWGHYYNCHHDGSKLTFEWEDTGEHVCPQCGTIWRGEPYDSARRFMVHNQLGIRTKALAMVGRITRDRKYVDEAVRVLSSYADYYVGYEIHGDIPYNGPGKLFAQTLDEAHWIINLCLAYALLEEQLDPTMRDRLKSRLFRPCAKFLIGHKEEQLHNHACWITGAIVCIGLILEEDQIVAGGWDGLYGLKDQLERGVLDDGLWYEGAFHYHYYAMHAFVWVSVLGEGTEMDLRSHPKFRRMFDMPLPFILPDGTVPILNDMHPGYGIYDLACYYEAAYTWYGDPAYVAVLRHVYAAKPRDSFEALLLGSDLEGDVMLGALATGVAYAKESGLALLRSHSGWHLTAKHAPFGGEHDHMDRLGLSFACGSVPLFTDCGTTAYGVPLHYGWFKHSYAHNTVVMNNLDQPPADAELIQCHKEAWGSWCEGAVEWKPDAAYRIEDSIQLPKHETDWDAELYSGIQLRRVNVLTEELLVDVMKVQVPTVRQVDLIYHMSAKLLESSGWHPSDAKLSNLDPTLFREKQERSVVAPFRLEWELADRVTTHEGWISTNARLIRAWTPDNPPTGNRLTLVQRVVGDGEIFFVNVFYLQSGAGASKGLKVMKSGKELELFIPTESGHQRARLRWEHSAAQVAMEMQD